MTRSQGRYGTPPAGMAGPFHSDVIECDSVRGSHGDQALSRL
jgi:hypothetical protein